MNTYKLIEKIGKGTHGTVYLLKSTEEEKLLVCKSVNSKYRNHAFREINILGKINHRRIVSMVDNIVIKDTVNIILEYINYGSVETMIKVFRDTGVYPSSSIGWSLLAQMSDALYYLHSRRIVHRDLKPSNILVSKFFVHDRECFEFKLCDFSLSTKCEDSIEDKHIVGTPFYMAPEIVSRERYDHRVDVWGLGCCVFELMKLKKPFEGKDRMELFENILFSDPFSTISSNNSYDGLDGMIKKCLMKKDRASARAIAKHERTRLNLAIIELKIKESRIEELERKLQEKH